MHGTGDVCDSLIRIKGGIVWTDTILEKLPD